MFLLVNKLYFSPALSPRPLAVSQPSSRTSSLCGAVLGGCRGGAQLQQPHPPGAGSSCPGNSLRGIGEKWAEILPDPVSVPTLPCCIPSRRCPAGASPLCPNRRRGFWGFFAPILFSTGSPRSLPSPLRAGASPGGVCTAEPPQLPPWCWGRQEAPMGVPSSPTKAASAPWAPPWGSQHFPSSLPLRWDPPEGARSAPPPVPAASPGSPPQPAGAVGPGGLRARCPHSPRVLACCCTSAGLKQSWQMGQGTQDGCSTPGSESSSPQREACAGSSAVLKQPAGKGSDGGVPKPPPQPQPLGTEPWAAPQSTHPSRGGTAPPRPLRWVPRRGLGVSLLRWVSPGELAEPCGGAAS